MLLSAEHSKATMPIKPHGSKRWQLRRLLRCFSRARAWRVLRCRKQPLALAEQSVRADIKFAFYKASTCPCSYGCMGERLSAASCMLDLKKRGMNDGDLFSCSEMAVGVMPHSAAS